MRINNMLNMQMRSGIYNKCKKMKMKKKYKIKNLSVKQINGLFEVDDIYLVYGLGKEFTETLYTSYNSAYNHINKKYNKEELTNTLDAYDIENLHMQYGDKFSKKDIIGCKIHKIEIEDFFIRAFAFEDFEIKIVRKK